ncbi:hypothetical protein PMN64_00550 [Bradyrhizobium sp. UFLA01-814]|uniref:hypothetical protein n=1 Tax=Bradyrhizobium sp. UFLA01-814 TaxID=3023480 RepID=UPI00398B6D42
MTRHFHRRFHETLDSTNEWPSTLSYWRQYGAESFDARRIAEVVACVARISSTIPDWRKAIDGDAAAAIGIVLPQPRPEKFTIRVDLPMTVLLNCAFHDAAAALVLSNRLMQMPLSEGHRTNLSTSWLVHKIWLDHKRTRPNWTWSAS